MIDSLSTWVRVRAGRVLCREGAIGREFFVIVDGSVTVHVPASRPIVSARVTDSARWRCWTTATGSATVTANEPTELIVFSVAEFDALLVQVPSWRRS